MKTKSLGGYFGISRRRLATLMLAGFAAAGVAYELLSSDTPEADKVTKAAAARPETIAPGQLPADPSIPLPEATLPSATEPARERLTSSPRTDSLPINSDDTASESVAAPSTLTRLAGGDGRRSSAASPMKPAQSVFLTQEDSPPSASSLVPLSGGRIFLPGLQHKRYADALICVDDKPLGSVKNLAEKGFVLKPGSYTIAVKDSTGRILHKKANVNVAKGDVKTLEFKD